MYQFFDLIRLLLLLIFGIINHKCNIDVEIKIVRVLLQSIDVVISHVGAVRNVFLQTVSIVSLLMNLALIPDVI